MLIGAGYIGTEMADALTHRGLEVTIVEMARAVLTTFDTDLGEIVGSELRRHGVQVECGRAVQRIEQREGVLHVVGNEGLDELDLSYTPPLSSPWDPIQTAAQSWLRTVR